jgi:hypothetical protein
VALFVRSRIFGRRRCDAKGFVRSLASLDGTGWSKQSHRQGICSLGSIARQIAGHDLGGLLPRLVLVFAN